MLLRALRLKAIRLFVSTIILSTIAAAWLGTRLTETASAQGGVQTFKNFESPQVHPLAVTPDGSHLLAVNSPNATLSVFQLSSGVPVLTAEIPVGLEPVSVAARNDREAWVVNWLSDSVSVVDIASGNVVRTLQVGDEPTDVLFAGTGREMAFVCASGGGHISVDGISVTGASGAVKVFDPSNLSAAPQTIEVFGKQPRALARDAAGSRVFVSVFESGNKTTVVPETVVRVNGGLPAPNPAMAAGLPPAPNTALIVRWNGSAWADETGDTKWNQFLNFTLADVDLVTLDATGQAASVAGLTRGFGTHLGNMAFDPTTSRLFVAALDSNNLLRFEPNLRGNFQESYVARLDASQPGAPTFIGGKGLNPHVNLANPNGTDAERALSLALPSDIVRASDGTYYVAAKSSAKVGFLDAQGDLLGRIDVGQGPAGLALDESRARLYVLNRFDETVSVVSTATKTQTAVVPVGFNPEQPAVRNGRRFLYDATNFSSHGTVSCASCHPSGHRDGIAWDLGDPTGSLVNVAGFTSHPMKGPMTTQSLRGLQNATPLHWRADRSSVTDFNVAFTGLLGSKRLLTSQEMAAFVNFVNTLSYPPNPNENVDRTFSNPATGSSPARGKNLFTFASGGQPILLSGTICNTCHIAIGGPASNNFQIGSDRAVFPGSILAEPQSFKVPQLRGVYQKAGMQKPLPGEPSAEQITGFGFMHDGAIDTMFNFLKQSSFQGFTGDNQRRDIEAFLLSFDSVIAPSVGLQVTANATNKSAPEVTGLVNLLVQQAQPVAIPGSQFPGTPNCDLVARGIYGGAPRAFLQTGGGLFQPDSLSEAPVSAQQLLDSVGAGSELTFTGVPVGEGRRFSIDRDGNNVLDDDAPRTLVQIAGRVVGADGAGLAGVSVTLAGTRSATAVTDAQGRYAFNYISTTGTHTVTPVGATFTPQSRTFTNPSWNQSADFVASATANAADSSQFFVTRHYTDFLNREPDAPGLAFWTNEIESCGANQQCREVRRINVSGAFFLSIEFQQTGYAAYKTYKASFGNLAGKPVPLTFDQLMSDGQRIGRGVIVGQGAWQALLETNKSAFFLGWVQRPDFLARFPVGMSAAAFVDTLNANTGGALNAAARDAIVNQLAATNNTQGRATALRQVVENGEFDSREKNRAFVLMQYFGYLRRNPNDPPQQNLDFEGYDFWLNKLEGAGGNFVEAEMVKAFLDSTEYRLRFGS